MHASFIFIILQVQCLFWNESTSTIVSQIVYEVKLSHERILHDTV